MTDFLALGVEEGESQRTVDRIEIHLGVERGREQAQHHRHQIKQRQRHRDDRHGHGKGRCVAVRHPRGLAQLLAVQAVLPVGHLADS